MKPRANTLFHFTKNIDALKGILKDGFYAKYCREDVRWSGVAAMDESMLFPMTCFCDIPLSRISEHTSFYGSYGIGLTKEWALRNSLSPVSYDTHGGVISNALSKFNELAKYIKEDEEERIKHELFAIMTALLSRTKPISGFMYLNGIRHDKDFYQESEWRHIPSGKIPITEEFVSQEGFIDFCNAELKTTPLKFDPKDVRYIFCRAESEIPILHDFITSNLSHFSMMDGKILTSRIVALEDLSSDM